MATNTPPETIEQASALGDLPRVQEWIQTLSTYRGTALEGNMLQRLQFSLCEAARHGHAAVFSHLLDQSLIISNNVIRNMQQGQSVDIFQALLNHGWDINSHVLGGTTSICLNLGNLDLVRWHLEHGADPNIKTKRGYTALDFAGYKYSLEVVKILIEYGADINNTTAIHNAVANSVKYHSLFPGRLDIVTYLLERGVNINQIEAFDDGYERPPVTPYTGTPLHRAVESENSEHVRFLLSRGADRSIKGVMGMTPLEVAEKDHLTQITAILYMSEV